jgi:hypothetical protein
MTTPAAIPSRVHIGALTYDVRLVPAGTSMPEGMESSDGYDSLGMTNSNRTLILIRDQSGQSRSQMRDTLLHEVLHGAVRVVDLHRQHIDLSDENDEERAVALLSTILLGVLRDNPDLVRVLVEPDL